MNNNSINISSIPSTLLNQKSNRIITTNIEDIDMISLPLSSTSHIPLGYSQCSPFPQKKMSLDINDTSTSPYMNIFPYNTSKLGCNCKHSQCLKRYCECFTRMKYCDPSICCCKNCYNTHKNEVSLIHLIYYHRKREQKPFIITCRNHLCHLRR